MLTVRPEVVDSEILQILLTTNFKYDPTKTSKSKSALETLVRAAIIAYDDNNLSGFDTIFRHSQLLGSIDAVEPSILSNITTLKLRRNVKATVDGTASGYDVVFGNALYNPHSGHNSSAGGILSSTGFKVTGSDLEQFLDDDGNGNVRRYYLSSGIRTYANETQGTIDYSTGQITLNSLNIASISGRCNSHLLFGLLE